MTKTICDICGKMWDICPECREDFNRWMVIRKSEAIKEVGK